MRTFFQCFLLISFLLQSLSANASLAPFAHHLKEIRQLNLAQTIERLAGYEDWASERGRAGVYNWLHSSLTLDRYTYLPIELLGTNTHAIWWFIQHSIDEGGLTPDNAKIQELAMMALTACKSRSLNINTEINHLLQSAFSIYGNHVFGEVLLNLITSNDDLKVIPVYYDKLFQIALISRNYRLVNLLLKHMKNENTAQYINLILSTLAMRPEVWEDHSAENLEFDDEGLSYELYPNDNIGATFYVNPYYSHREDSEPTPSEFYQILNWLQENQQQNSRAFHAALDQAGNRRHHAAIAWLNSIGITESETDNNAPENSVPENSVPDLQLEPPSQAEGGGRYFFWPGFFCLKWFSRH